MGHRIELGEIESATLKNESVSRACCVYDDSAKRIVLYYVGNIEEKNILMHLNTLLPRYMLPAELVQLAVMPLTPNGKIDRKGLNERAQSN
jgi:acyl-coenzyme A synthetase/AMP-(fatty) acid ligase